jgi:hypothetical protein
MIQCGEKNDWARYLIDEGFAAFQERHTVLARNWSRNGRNDKIELREKFNPRKNMFFSTVFSGGLRKRVSTGGCMGHLQLLHTNDLRRFKAYVHHGQDQKLRGNCLSETDFPAPKSTLDDIIWRYLKNGHHWRHQLIALGGGGFFMPGTHWYIIQRQTEQIDTA